VARVVFDPGLSRDMHQAWTFEIRKPPFKKQIFAEKRMALLVRAEAVSLKKAFQALTSSALLAERYLESNGQCLRGHQLRKRADCRRVW
jgi:hypothetical protein